MIVAAGLGFLMFAVVVSIAWLISPAVGAAAVGVLVLVAAIGSVLHGGQPGG